MTITSIDYWADNYYYCSYIESTGQRVVVILKITDDTKPTYTNLTQQL